MAPPCGHSYDQPPVPDCAACRIREVPFHKARWTGVTSQCIHLGPGTGKTALKLICDIDPPCKIELRECKKHSTCTEYTAARNTQCCKFCSDKKLQAN